METALKHKSLIISVLTLTFTRLIINMARRFPYPFLPAISRELDTSLASVQSVMATQAGVGVTSPLFGPLSDHYGRKRVILGLLTMMTAASVLGAFLPRFAVFAPVLILFGVGKMIYDPAMQAYLSERVPYHRRALAIGTTELSWAGSLIVAAPLAGFLLDTSGLQSIFVMLTAAFIFALMIVWIYLPPDYPDKRTTTIRAIMPLEAWRIIRHNRAAISAIVYTFLLVVANEIFFINYGVWMELSFDLVLAALGAATTVIAVGEVLGEFTVIGFADRFGKRRMALIGTIGSSLCYAVLPHLNFSLNAALVGLFLSFLFVETGIVASIPIFTEILPESRSVMMSGTTGAASFGRLVGAAVGGFLYSITDNFMLIGSLAMCTGLIAAAFLWLFIHE